MTWKKQIQTAIHYDSNPAQTKYDPLPNIEIEFWIARAENLQGIKTQVCNDALLIVNEINLNRCIRH